MKSFIDHLPIEKQEELKMIVKYIRSEVSDTEAIILYGSYAAGNYVEYDQRKEFTYRTYYKSDYDLLVLTTKNVEHNFVMNQLDKVTARFSRGHHYSNVTPIQFIHEEIKGFQKTVEEGHYFECEIIKKGILLYSKSEFTIKEVEPDKWDKRQLAEEYYKDKFSRASAFLRSAKHALNDKDYPNALFYLHQVAEYCISGILLTATLYSPKEHNLKRLIEYANNHLTHEVEFFPMETDIEKELFNLLEEGYISARYNANFVVTKEQLLSLFPYLEKLKGTTEQYCESRIKEYN